MNNLKFLKDKMWWLNILVILMWSCFKNQPPRSFLISWCITLWLRVWHLRGKWYEVWRVWEKVWLFQVRLPFGNLQEDIQVDVFCALYLGICFSWIIFTVGFWCQTIHKEILRRFVTMMVKSGLEKNILRFHDGLQSCYCPVPKNLPRKAELAWQVSRYLWRG